MNKLHVSTLAMLVAALAACGDRAPAPAQTASTGADASTRPAPKTALGRRVDEAMDKARAKLATENISLTDLQVSGNSRGISISTNDGSNTDSRRKAEITPQGDLLIEGRKVQTNAQQQALLVDYRKQVEAVASAGMDIGVAGADLGIQAATQALASVFSGGNPDEIEKRVEDEAQEIEVAARKLCDQLPAMLQTQTALAASLPEFKPYATMEQSDIDDCYEQDKGDRAQVQQQTRNEIRSAIRSSIQTATQAAGVAPNNPPATDAAAEAEAASAEDATRR
jgi:preprotein translocase subunit SecD